MKCPKCGNELKRSQINPEYGLCYNCKEKFKWKEETIGKSFCENCGTRFDGRFCPECGCPNIGDKVEISTPKETKHKTKWYEKNLFVILMLIFIWPVGLILIWKFKKNWNKVIKIILTVVCVLSASSVANEIMNYESYDTEEDSISSDVAEVPETSEETSYDTEEESIAPDVAEIPETSEETSNDTDASKEDSTSQYSDTSGNAGESTEDCSSCDGGVCGYCYGTGLKECNLCDDPGVCALCGGNGDGIGDHPCVRCEGSGKCPYDDDLCIYCEGTKECFICDGAGTRVVSSQSEYSSSGDAYYNDYDYSYDSSTNSKTICPKCGGSGRKTCTSCGGVGYFSFKKESANYGGGSYSYYEKKDCYCSGGSLSCTRCGGRGYY